MCVFVVLRLGRSHAMLESAFKSIHMDDRFLRHVITLSHVNQVCYCLLDNALWLNSVGLIGLDAAKEKALTKWSNKFWIFTSVLCLTRDINELLHVRACDATVEASFHSIGKYRLDESSCAYTSLPDTEKKRITTRLIRWTRALIVNKKNHPLVLDTLKNICETMLSMSTLDYVKLSPGAQGFYGLVSSLIALQVMWNPAYRLMP